MNIRTAVLSTLLASFTVAPLALEIGRAHV